MLVLQTFAQSELPYKVTPTFSVPSARQLAPTPFTDPHLHDSPLVLYLICTEAIFVNDFPSIMVDDLMPQVSVASSVFTLELLHCGNGALPLISNKNISGLEPHVTKTL